MRLFLFISRILPVWEVCLLVNRQEVHALSSANAHQRASSQLPPSKERTVVILYHKPAGVVTTHNSQDDRPTVYNEVQSMMGFLPSQEMKESTTTTTNLSFQEATGIHSKLHAVGRLDTDTTGLLLLTNDGSLVHHVTNPTSKSHDNNNPDTITKTYRALIMGHHTHETLQEVRNGVDIGAKYGGMTRPYPNHKSTVVSITISEGKNRQVRRMFHAIGSGVMQLQRTRIGDTLTLEGVEEGEWRILTDEEVRTALNWEPREIEVAHEASPKRRRHQAAPSTKRTRRRRGS
ncbi:MAG: hypothetical protein SGARI_005630 [Bacillariaceae sp.]